jgi:hypothetical protein
MVKEWFVHSPSHLIHDHRAEKFATPLIPASVPISTSSLVPVCIAQLGMLQTYLCRYEEKEREEAFFGGRLSATLALDI